VLEVLEVPGVPGVPDVPEVQVRKVPKAQVPAATDGHTLRGREGAICTGIEQVRAPRRLCL